MQIELFDRIKHRFVLRIPSQATAAVTAAWHAQSHNLTELYEMAQAAQPATVSLSQRSFSD